MTNKLNTVLYTGCTDDLIKRVWQHKNKLTDSFTSRYNINKLVYYEVCEDPLTMINREKTIKNLLRRKKLDLIKSFNPQLLDLYEKIV